MISIKKLKNLQVRVVYFKQYNAIIAISAESCMQFVLTANQTSSKESLSYEKLLAFGIKQSHSQPK